MEKESINCSKCGSPNSVGATFCKLCGARLDMSARDITPSPKLAHSKKSNTPIVVGLGFILIIAVAFLLLARAPGIIPPILQPPKEVTVEGAITTSGSGTRATRIIFSGAQGEVPIGIINNGYSVTLQNPGTYKVSIEWSGSFAFQRSSVEMGQLSLNQGIGAPSRVSRNWMVQTPASVITVTGAVTTTGAGTHPTRVAFRSNREGQVYTAQVSDRDFSTNLPNLAAYTVTVEWSGNFPWQSGTVEVAEVNINQGPGTSQKITTQSWKAATPSSIIRVTGSVSTRGAGTNPTGAAFTSGRDRQVLTASVVGGQYSIDLPNDSDYTVRVAWSGLLGARGTCEGGTLQIHFGPETTRIQQNWSC